MKKTLIAAAALLAASTVMAQAGDTLKKIKDSGSIGSMPFCVETLRVMSAWLARTDWPAGA